MTRERSDRLAAQQEELNALLDDYVAVIRLVGTGEANFGVFEALVDKYHRALFVHTDARINELLDERMKRETP